MREWFRDLKINQKFTIMTGMIIFIPMLLLWIIFFQNTQSNDISEEMYATESAMTETYNTLQKTVELCNMTTEVFLNNRNLIDMLSKLSEKKDITTEDFVVFKQNDIAVLERLVNSNPYLYQARVYANDNNFPEMMPILYHKDRMKQLPWAEDYESGKWYFDYTDAIFPESVMNSADHMMSLVTSLSNYEYGQVGTVEVSVQMDSIFPQVFEIDQAQWSCFIDKDGFIYSNQAEEKDCIWESRKNQIITAVSNQMKRKENCCIQTKIGDKKVIICYMSVPELGGHMITLKSLDGVMKRNQFQRNIMLWVLLLGFTVMIIVVNMLVKSILRNFYNMLEIIRQVQLGDLNVRFENCGMDEVGELGNQFNVMLDRIENLMAENINREVLAKNSEIRALQNQINAHFIYNVLESIKMMAEIDEEYEISDAITSLGKLLRYSMRWTSPTVTLEEELEYIKNYLDLINLRFDYRINLAVHMPKVAYLQQIPKMSLQPIIENAIIHGVEELAEDATIYIKGFIKDDTMTIEITDSGRGMTLEEIQQLRRKIAGEVEVSGGSGNGIGLKNVQDRIQMTYGSQYGIDVVSKIGCFTKIIMRVPIYKGKVKK